MSQPIANGDDASAYNEVFRVAISKKDGSQGTCSGVLITPVHVLTSAHCFREVLLFSQQTTAAASATAVVTLSNDPLGNFNALPLATSPGGAPFSVTHTPGVAPGTGTGPGNPAIPQPSHVVQTWSQLSPMVEYASGFADQDLALIPLDARIPLSRVTPAKLPFEPYAPPFLGLDSCDAPFTGEYIGFGSGPPLWNLVVPFAPPNATKRRRGTHTIIANGNHYEGEFHLLSDTFSFIPVLGDVLSALTGSGDSQYLQDGDSGGPLYQPSAGFKLCGTNSRLVPLEPDCDPVIPGVPFPVTCSLDTTNEHTRVDRESAAIWIRDRIVDSTDARFMGTCDQAPADTDTDGDLVPDGCDPCPLLPEPGYNLDRTPDPDNDGVPSRCDNCPTVYNPPPGVAGNIVLGLVAPDFDNDGIGDACDWEPLWPSTNNPLTNQNMEAEIIAHYPNLASEPVAKNASEAATYAAAFRTGTNEPVPAPVFVVGNGLLPASSAAGHAPVPSPNPVGPGSCAGELDGQFGDQCHVDVVNRIRHRPSVPTSVAPGFAHPATGRTGTVATRWCRYGGPGLQNTWTARLGSRDDCPPTDAFFGGINSPWREIAVTPYTNAYGPPPHPTWLSSPQQLNQVYPFVNNTEPADLLWDFTQLGNGCTNPADPGELSCENMYSRAYGVLWNDVRQMPGLPSVLDGAPVPLDLLHSRGGYFWSGNAGYRVTKGKNFFKILKWSQALSAVLETPCWWDGCGGGPLTPVIFNPESIVPPPPGADPTRTMVPCLPGATGCYPVDPKFLGTARGIVARAWLDSDRVFVAASEPPGRLASLDPPGPQLRAAVLQRSTALPLELVTTTGAFGDVVGVSVRSLPGDGIPPDDGPISAAQFDSLFGTTAFSCSALGQVSGCPGAVLDAEGVALSGSQRELLVLGGLENGAPRASAWFLPLGGTWQEAPLHPSERPGDVLAAGYHFADDSFYVLDRTGVMVRLRGFSRATREMKTVAKWPSPWQLFDRYWLVSGQDGDLYVAATRKHFTAAARFELSSSGKLVFAGVAHEPAESLTRPLAGYGVLALVVPPAANAAKNEGLPGFPGGPTRGVIPLERFHPKPKAWCPTGP